MDAVSIPAQATQPYRPNSSLVPPEIYRSLFDIAKQGYEASDVITWYLEVKRDLQHLNTANADTSYSLTPPFSVCSPVPPEQETQSVNRPFQSPADPQSLSKTPTNNPDLWFNPLIPDPFHSDQTIATTSANKLQICTTSAAEQGSFLQMSSPWSTTVPTFPTIPTNANSSNIYATNQQMPPIYDQAPYYNPEQLSPLDAASRKRRASQPPTSYLPIGNPPASFNPPFNPTMPTQAPHFPPNTLSSELTYLAPISIIPSRKRRKTLPKGMKKVIQPVQLQRQF